MPASVSEFVICRIPSTCGLSVPTRRDNAARFCAGEPKKEDVFILALHGKENIKAAERPLAAQKLSAVIVKEVNQKLESGLKIS